MTTIELKLLKLYKEEITSGEVSQEDLLEYHRMLSLDFKKDKYEVMEILEKTRKLHLYFIRNLYFYDSAFNWFPQLISTAHHKENDDIYHLVKQTCKLFLYSNAAKVINF